MNSANGCTCYPVTAAGVMVSDPQCPAHGTPPVKFTVTEPSSERIEPCFGQCGIADLRAQLTSLTEAVARLEQERDELLLDRHQPHRVAPCGHYRVFVMPLGHEDGPETAYCMQCHRDDLQVQLKAFTEAVAQLRQQQAWQPIETAPKDGTRLKLKRVYRNEIVAEGVGYFGDVTIHYGGYPFVNAALETDYAEPFDETHRGVWIHEDGCHLFPTPTHWLPPTPDPAPRQE